MQAENYSFSQKSEERFKKLETQFPQRGSLVLWALHLVQDDIGFVSKSAVTYVAERVGVSEAWVKGVLSFYSMYHEHPIGKYNLNVCYNVSCWMHGSDDLEACITRKLNIKPGETTSDGLFTFTRQVECLAGCGKAPVVQINDDYYENLTPEKFEQLIDEFTEKGKAGA